MEDVHDDEQHEEHIIEKNRNFFAKSLFGSFHIWNVSVARSLGAGRGAA